MHDQLTNDQAHRSTRLLHMLNTARLGHGDEIVGANVFVAHCAAIAAIYPAEHGLKDSNEQPVPVGISIAVAGSLTDSLTREQVSSKLSDEQNNLLDHHRAWEDYLEGEEAKPHLQRTPDGINRIKGAKPPYFAEYVKSDEATSYPCYPLLQGIKSPHVETHYRPVVCSHANTPAQVMSVILKSHFRRPLLEVRLVDINSCRAFSESCGGIMDGCCVPGEPGRTCRGFVIAHLAPHLLPEVQTATARRSADCH